MVERRARRRVDGELVEIAPSYIDVWGKTREIDSGTRAALLQALGPERKISRIILKAGRCHQPEFLERGGRAWGFALQLYGLRSARNWGIGDFGDLRAVVEQAAKLGAGVIGLNPLHAASLSPYSPSSRHALNPLYIEIEAPGPKKLRDSELVDYPAVRKAKYQAFEKLYPGTAVRLPTKGLRDFAVFEALREELGDDWRRWPEEYRSPASPAVKRFAAKNTRRVGFHAWLQVRAREQLDAVQARALKLGMPVGLYVDLALGADRGGAEVWSDPEAYAMTVSTGAPPDEFNPKGQDWGLPPYSPRALRARRFRPFAELLRANMPRGGALRIDHVMALMRLYWIPLGAKADRGGYVSYPLRELVAVLAEESRRNRCMVIGEDLGTVPPEVREALTAAGVLSYRPLLFERRAPADFPRDALVCVSTHDLPTWRGYWAGRDLALRERVGLTVDIGKEKSQRKADQKSLAALLASQGLDTSVRSAHAFIARTPAKLVVVQPEDVFGMAEQANLPGTVEEHPNWRRKLPLPVEQWASDARIAALGELFAGKKPIADPGRSPVATYRLQLHAGFGFRAATAIVPYLARLGVSHVYASPFLRARQGSLHGYDIVDHNALNPEIGSQGDFDKFMRALERHGLALVLDVVPNHMGVLGAYNPWWQDVLARGRRSPFAKFFDIDWRPGKLLLPVLGRHYGEALEKGEIRLKKRGRYWKLCYFDHEFPVRGKVTGKELRDPLALHRLLEKQHYRLAYWRVASDEINYRRFFEITDLAAVRSEDPEVFAATHRLIAKLAKRKGVDGVRVDHPDGLADPYEYLERLGGLFSRPWVLVEKILADHEKLRGDWPIHGTTGYRFANFLTAVFIDGGARSRFDRIYQSFTGDRRTFEEHSRDGRMLIMGTTLFAELTMLADRLARIASGNRATRDYTASGLRKALAEIAARFPVYRTYVSKRGVSDTDRRHIGWAVGAARRASRIADPSVFDFVQSVLTLDAAPPGGPRRAQMLEFAMRFQQFTSPVVAKGVEDTAFYRYVRLAALNEVGNDPRNFGVSLKAFHAASASRARNWPYTMLGTSTHDTKRSEDVRARLGVLSELAPGWKLALRRWSRMNRGARTERDGESLPSRGDEYLYYQTLLSIWPGESREDLRERVKAAMLKAAREAKVHSSWINPDQEYEQALERFVVESLKNKAFVEDVERTVAPLAHLGLLVGLSQALVKVASPGVPDYYQGTETWDFSLVDPDNRRPVDYRLRKKLLDSKPKLEDGSAKLHIIRKGLELRKAFPALFHGGTYVPLDGGENILAFALRAGGKTLVAIAPRLFAKITSWEKAGVALPAGFPAAFKNVLTGRGVRARDGHLRLADLLSDFPVALLIDA
ncbi:MAG: 4-alpha-glucanotransferase [Betaproteobacteria bacterium]|nr:4-alpha-glucanotransferase [Betaproteobacteria bacterium]